MKRAKKVQKASKSKAKAMGQQAVRRSTQPTPDPAYDFYVSTDGVRVIVSGVYDGGILADAGQLVRFNYAGDPGYGGFVITATELKKNSNKSNASSKNPFEDPLPTGAVLEFQSKLKHGGGPKLRLLKYQICVGNLIPADPFIIIQR